MKPKFILQISDNHQSVAPFGVLSHTLSEWSLISGVNCYEG